MYIRVYINLKNGRYKYPYNNILKQKNDLYLYNNMISYIVIYIEGLA